MDSALTLGITLYYPFTMSQLETNRAQLYTADVQELGSVFDPLHPHIDAIKRNIIDPFETWPLFPYRFIVPPGMHPHSDDYWKLFFASTYEKVMASKSLEQLSELLTLCGRVTEP